jgi:hypothetical protein
MKNILVGMTVALIACSTASQARPAPAVPQTPAPPAPVAQPSAAPVVDTPPADNGLNDLAAMTFACPKAALNAAAREAAKAPSEGTYQFAHFGIVSDSHHAMYEVTFKSNYQSEPLLRYCVAIYCQQGWDPKTTKAVVTLMGDTTHAPAAQAREPQCGDKSMHVGAHREP